METSKSHFVYTFGWWWWVCEGFSISSCSYYWALCVGALSYCSTDTTITSCHMAQMQWGPVAVSQHFGSHALLSLLELKRVARLCFIACLLETQAWQYLSTAFTVQSSLQLQVQMSCYQRYFHVFTSSPNCYISLIVNFSWCLLPIVSFSDCLYLFLRGWLFRFSSPSAANSRFPLLYIYLLRSYWKKITQVTSFTDSLQSRA